MKKLPADIPEKVLVYRFVDGHGIYRVLSWDLIEPHLYWTTAADDPGDPRFFLESHDGQRLSAAWTTSSQPGRLHVIHQPHRDSIRYWREFSDQVIPDSAEHKDDAFAFPIEVPDGIHSVLSGLKDEERKFQALWAPRIDLARIEKILEQMRTMLQMAFLTQRPDLFHVDEDWDSSSTTAGFTIWLANIQGEKPLKFVFDFGEDAQRFYWVVRGPNMYITKPTLESLWHEIEAQLQNNRRPLVETSKLDAWWEAQYVPGEFTVDMESYLLLDAVLPVVFSTQDFIVWLRASGHL